LLKKGYEVDGISRIFHNTVIKIIVEITKKISEQEKIYSVALSGGTFQNKFLLRWAVELLKKEGFAVYLNTKVPSNDGGIALGQLYNAAFIRNFKK